MHSKNIRFTFAIKVMLWFLKCYFKQNSVEKNINYNKPFSFLKNQVYKTKKILNMSYLRMVLIMVLIFNNGNNILGFKSIKISL